MFFSFWFFIIVMLFLISELVNFILDIISSKQGCQEWRLRRSAIVGQEKFMTKLVQLVVLVARESGNRKKKVSYFMQFQKYVCLNLSNSSFEIIF